MEGASVKGMKAIVTALTTSLTADTFFSVIVDIVPFLAVIIPVALGFHVLRKLIKGAGKAKVRM